jgi:hypothetical protein
MGRDERHMSDVNEEKYHESDPSFPKTSFNHRRPGGNAGRLPQKRYANRQRQPE